MANQRQDVELRIRATNYSKQTTDEVVKSLKGLTAAQDAQIESAKKGTATVAQLEAEYGKLEAAAKALLSQNAVIKLFQAQTAALTELETKLAAARKAQKDYADSLTPGAERTKAQEAAMRKLNATVASMEKQFGRAQDRVDTTSKRLATFGINSNNLADSQQKIITAVEGANAALARQEAAINGADAGAAKRKAAADAIAQRELQVKVDNQFSAAERNLAQALEAERVAQLAANAAAAASQHDKQTQADILFTNAERVVTEQIKAKSAALLAQRTAMLAAADAAERLARGSVTTARGTGPVVTPDLGARLRDIANPSEAAMRSVNGIEQAIKGLETRVTAIRGPVQDYRGALEAATGAQRALSQVAGQVDSYQRQLTALRASRIEFAANRVAVNTLIAEMRSGAAGDDITTRLARAQATLQQSAGSMGQITTAARATRDALRLAGIDTRNLTDAEAALVAQANRAAGATNSLTEAFRRNGAAAQQSGSRILSMFGADGGRTTLSYAQRLRGEVLGLAAGFVGLNATIGLGKKALESYQVNQAIMSRLLIANGGDAVKAGDDFKYLQAQADRIGFVFQKIAPAYTKFAIAARAANFTTQETRFTFEQIAGSAVKARLSTEELEGVMKAFEQIMSKGTIQAEELRGQLGDRLPGAFQIAARAAKMTVEEYTKAISLGQIGSDQVIAIARELGKTYGAAQEGASGLLEAQARFQNAADRFLTSTAEGGFVKAYQGFLAKLTTLLNSGQGDKLATQLSAGFSAVIDVLGFVADHIDGITFAIKALIGLSFLKWLASLPLLIAAVRTELLLVNVQLGVFQAYLARASAASALTTALGAGGLAGVIARLTPLLVGCGTALLFIARAIPVVGAAIAAYQATRFIVESLDDDLRKQVRGAIRNTELAVLEAEKAEKAAREAKGTRDEARLKAEYERLSGIAVVATKKQAALLAQARKENIDMTGLADTVQKKADPVTAAMTEDPGDRQGDKLKALKKALDAEDKRSDKAARSARMKSAKEELQDRLDIIDEPFQVMRDNYKTSITDEGEYQKALALINASSLKAQAAERMKFNNEQQKQGESAATKRVQLAFEIQQKLKEIEDDIAKRNAEADPTEPFETRRLARIKAIGNAYDEVAKKIMKEKNLDPTAAAKDQAKLDVLTKERQELESQNSYRDEANRLLDVFNKKQAILKAQQDEITTLAQSGQITAAKALEDQNKLLTETGPGVRAAGQEALDFAMKFRGMLDPVVFQQAVATIQADLAKVNVEAAVATNNLNAQQTVLNQTLEGQARAIETITLKRSLGLISSEQEAAALNATTAEYKDKILDNNNELLKLLDTSLALGAISEEAYAKAKAGADNLTLSTKFARKSFDELDMTITNSIVNNGVSAFETLGNEIGKVVMGTESLGEGFRNALSAVGNFFASLLRDIAMAIVKQMILKALIQAMGAGSPIGSAAVSLGGVIAGGQHNGGITGRTTSFKRRVDPSIFAGAQRLHSGGMPGLSPNEVPTILEKNEEVLTRDDPRHVLNGGGSAGGGSNRFVLVDDRSGVPEAMASSEGEKVTLVHLKNNLPTIKQWIK